MGTWPSVSANRVPGATLLPRTQPPQGQLMVTAWVKPQTWPALPLYVGMPDPKYGAKALAGRGDTALSRPLQLCGASKAKAWYRSGTGSLSRGRPMIPWPCGLHPEHPQAMGCLVVCCPCPIAHMPCAKQVVIH